MIIEEYEFSNNSLSYNEPEAIKKTLMRSQPQTLLALNSKVLWQGNGAYRQHD